MLSTSLPPLPEQLRGRAVSLRLQTEDDLPFLSRLYAATRWEELEPTGWSDALKTSFLEHQFLLQHTHYTKHYSGGAAGIVEVDGVPAGRLYLLQTPGDLRMVDIGLLPEHRNRGYGSGLIEAVIEQAAAGDSKVSIHVETNNPARRLYTRLGFRGVTEFDAREVYQLMEWSPDHN